MGESQRSRITFIDALSAVGRASLGMLVQRFRMAARTGDPSFDRLDGQCLPRPRTTLGDCNESTIMHGCGRLDDIAVVIVDDDDAIRFSLAGYLTGRVATVFTCSDAREGLEAVRTHRPHIVLSDIGLPNRNGFELLQDIRSLDAEQGGEVPVIAMTALERNMDRTRTSGDAFQALLHKPFRPDQLLAAVVSTLDRNQK